MANTRQSGKRARQTKKRNVRNTIVRSSTKTTFKAALDAVKAGDLAKAKDAYISAVKAMAKAASKGAIPSARAARKISRLTHFVKKMKPEILTSKSK